MSILIIKQANIYTARHKTNANYYGNLVFD